MRPPPSDQMWFTEDGQRFFLIPSSESFDAGPLLLRDWRFQEIRVMPDAVAAFEVDRDAAGEWTREKLGRALDSTRTAALSVLGKLHVSITAAMTDQGVAASRVNAPDPGSIERDSHEIAPRRLMEDLAPLQLAALESEPDEDDEERLDAWNRAVVATFGREIEDPVEEPDDVEELLGALFARMDDEERGEASPEHLEELASRVEQAAADVAARLRRLARGEVHVVSATALAPEEPAAEHEQPAIDVAPAPENEPELALAHEPEPQALTEPEPDPMLNPPPLHEVHDAEAVDRRGGDAQPSRRNDPNDPEPARGVAEPIEPDPPTESARDAPSAEFNEAEVEDSRRSSAITWEDEPMEPATRSGIPGDRPKSEPPNPPHGDHRPNSPTSLLLMFILGGALVGGGIYLGWMLTKSETPADGAGVAPHELNNAVGKLESTFGDRLAALEKKVDAAGKNASTTQAANAEIEALGKRVDELAAEPAPSVDLRPIEAKVADLGKNADALRETIEGLQSDLSEQKKATEDLRGRIDALPKSAESPPSGSSSTATTSDSEADVEARLADAVEQFHKNEFGSAREAFARLRASGVEDARVWYYSALATGFATNEWERGSETLDLVNHGMELEQQGKPEKPKIDAAFEDLAPSAKAWIDAFRARVAR